MCLFLLSNLATKYDCFSNFWGGKMKTIPLLKMSAIHLCPLLFWALIKEKGKKSCVINGEGEKGWEGSKVGNLAGSQACPLGLLSWTQLSTSKM